MKNALRRRITPFVPFSTMIENADGGKFEVNFKLSFDFNALALVEEKTGLNALSGEVFSKPSARNTVVLFWAAIQENHPEYAGEEGLHAVGSLLGLGNAKDALSAVNAAFVASLPKDKQELSGAEGGETPNAQSAQ
jgi:hypothetical protein